MPPTAVIHLIVLAERQPPSATYSSPWWAILY